MTFATWYSVGKVSVTAGLREVTGTGTLWTGTIKAGCYLWVGGATCRIASVDGPSALTLAHDWPGDTAEDADYEAMIVLDAVGYQKRTAELLALLSNGKLASMAGLEAVAQTLPYFNSEATFDLAPLTEFGRSLIAAENAPGVLSELGTSEFMAGLLDEENADTLLTALGFSAFLRGLRDNSDGPSIVNDLGATSTGMALLYAASAAAAQTAIGATDIGKSVIAAATPLAAANIIKAVGFSADQSLTQAEKGQALKNAGSAWEQIGNAINLAGVNYATWTGLSAYRRLRLTVNALPVAGMGFPILRVSKDNGLSFAAGASDYGVAGFAIYGGAQGILPTALGSYYAMTKAEMLASNIEYVADLTNFNKPVSTYLRSAGTSGQAPGHHIFCEFWGYVSSEIADNALLFGTSNGLAFASGAAILEGVRG